MAGIEPVTARPPHSVGFPFLMQGWRDVVFLHWPCAPEDVSNLLPAHTMPDVIDGQAWIGIVGIRITWMHAMAVPVLPRLRHVVELNVRTYCVDGRGRRSLVFLTMEASHAPFVLAARIGGRLPYRLATVDHAGTGPDIAYRCERYRSGPSRVGMSLRVQPGRQLEPTWFDHFVTARWRLHTRWYGWTIHVPIAHQPWPLHSARLLDFEDHGLLAQVGVPEPSDIPSVLYAQGVDTRFGAPSAFVGRPDRTR
jgi:uncharacterized protein